MTHRHHFPVIKFEDAADLWALDLQKLGHCPVEIAAITQRPLSEIHALLVDVAMDEREELQAAGAVHGVLQ